MTRTEALLKLLQHGALTYREILGNMGGNAFEVHEIVNKLKDSGAITLKRTHSSKPVFLYEINPEHTPKTEVQELPSSQGNERIVEPVRSDLPVLRGANHPSDSEATDTEGGEISAVHCPACGLDAIRARRGHAAGTCRHKTICGSTVI